MVERARNEPLPIRGELLCEATNLTLGDRNKSYGDPLDNFGGIAQLTHMFWNVVDRHAVTRHADDKITFDPARSNMYRNTPLGHALDMVLLKLGRIATAPSLDQASKRDHFADLVAYAAIAFELATRAGTGFVEVGKPVK